MKGLVMVVLLCAAAAYADTQIAPSQCCQYSAFCANGVLCPTGGVIYNNSTCVNAVFGGRCVPNTPISNFYNPTYHASPIYTPTSYRSPTPTFTPIRR